MDIQKIKTGIKRFFSNPNTLTFLLVIVLIIIIFVVYKSMINKAVSPVNIPYCTKKIKSMTEITDDYISSISISGGFVSANGSTLVQNTRNVRGKYVSPGYFIPENSFFYSEALVDETIKDTTDFTNIEDNQTIYKYKTNFHKTYGCSIMPGNYIDIYFKGKDVDGKLIFLPFVDSIRVASVKDKNGKDVFTESESEEPKPEVISFVVPVETAVTLKKIENMRQVDAELILVPRNAGFTENPKKTVYNETYGTAILEFLEQYSSSKKGQYEN